MQFLYPNVFETLLRHIIIKDVENTDLYNKWSFYTSIYKYLSKIEGYYWDKTLTHSSADKDKQLWENLSF